MGGVFDRWHPLNSFVYFLLVLLLTMFFLHPVALGVSLTTAGCLALALARGGGQKKRLLWLLPLLLLTAVLSPLFNHQGVTVLAWFPNGNPLTAESIYYGLAAAAMLIAVIVWFYCCNRVLTTDKLTWLFGRVAPALALVLTMTLRFVPRLRARIRAVAAVTRQRRKLTDLRIQIIGDALQIILCLIAAEGNDLAVNKNLDGIFFRHGGVFSCLYSMQNSQTDYKAWPSIRQRARAI